MGLERERGDFDVNNILRFKMEKGYFPTLLILSALLFCSLAVRTLPYQCPSPTGTLVTGNSCPNLRPSPSLIVRRCHHNQSRQLLLQSHSA